MQNKTINKEIEKFFVADAGSMSHMVNSMKNMIKLREVNTVVNTEKIKMMMEAENRW